MSSTSPAILPISNPQTPSPPPTALRQFLSNVSDTISTNLSNRRPFSELVDRSAFSKPDSLSDATHRIRKNYTYFRTNYLTIVTCILAISLITNPFSLLLLTSLLAAWLFLYLFRTSSDPPLTVLGRQFSNTETLVGLIVATIVVIFLTSVGSVLVSALMIGVAVVCVHAAFRAPEDLFVDEQENPATGFLSFLSAGAANNAVANAVVSARA